MRALWTAAAPLSASAIQVTFDDPAPAQTTVLTVLSRLETKGMVTRRALSPGGSPSKQPSVARRRTPPTWSRCSRTPRTARMH